MEIDKRDDIMRHFPKLLSRWKGISARLWELTSSHPTLRITLYDRERDGSLEVICISPKHIKAPLRWDNSDIQVKKSQNEGFDVIDMNAGVLISECGVEIKEFDKKPHERR